MGKLEVDKELIRELASLLDETGLTEIEIGDDDNRVRVARQAMLVSAAAPAAAGNATLATAPAVADAAATTAEHFADHPGAVTSPMVGTAYRAAEPGAPQFVNVGDTVEVGDTLFIIEAMKTFNDISASRGGTVTKIFVENGSPVEYGDVLLVIE